MAWVELSFTEDLTQYVNWFNSDYYWAYWDITTLNVDDYALPAPTLVSKVRITFDNVPTTFSGLTYPDTALSTISDLFIRVFRPADTSIGATVPVTAGVAVMDLVAVAGAPQTISAITSTNFLEHAVVHPGGVVSSIIGKIEYETAGVAAQEFWTAYAGTEEVEL